MVARKSIVSLFFIIFILTAITFADDIHWGYDGEGGVDDWEEQWAICGEGFAQSPIDISDATDVGLNDIAFNYTMTALNIFNNGHTIQVNVDEGSSIIYNGIVYNLLQFHFHAPSEHTVNGIKADMEIHFVHQDPNSGNLAVVGILLVGDEESSDNYTTIFANLPTEEGEPEATDLTIDLASLLPDDAGFYTYNGSLTTPPCSEIVRWLVLDTEINLASDDMSSFTAIHNGNARPTEPLGARDLLHDND